jgi:predicted transcriptional regulator
MSLMSVMADKGMLRQKAEGKAYIYSAKVSRNKTQSRMLGDLLNRAFDGSASALVTHLLRETEPGIEEMDEIRQAIAEFGKKKGGA